MNRPLASVVVPTWNGRHHIESCLTSLLAQDHAPLEVLAVDNSSTDGTPDLVADAFPSVQLLRERRNLGFAGGVNAGCRAAEGEVLVLLNQDAVVEREWLGRLCDALAQPGVGIAGGKGLFPDRRTVQTAGGSIRWPLGTVENHGHYEPDATAGTKPADVDFVSGCGMAFRRPLLEEIGPFDETFWPGYYEDVDFCLRARRAGHLCRYVPAARLLHAESSAFRAWTSIWRFHHRGRLHFVLKHTPPADLLARFLPTEELYLPALLATVPGPTLARAYTESVRRSLPPLKERGHLSTEEADQIAAGLLRLAGAARRGTTGRPGSDPPPECLAAALDESCAHLNRSLRHFRFALEQTGDGTRLRRENDDLRVALAAGEVELARTRDTVRDAERELASVRDVLQARDDELANHGRELASVKEVLSARDEQLARFRRQSAARDEQLFAVQAELDRLRRHLLVRVVSRLDKFLHGTPRRGG